ncbi:MAG: histidine kinase [bacterium]|nr:histidine kinase [bacterium]
MAENELKSHWQDWTLFGLRWVFLFGVSLLLYVIRSQSGVSVETQDLIVAFGIGAGLTLLFGVMIVFPNFRNILPFFVVAMDWGLTGVYVYVSQLHLRTSSPSFGAELAVIAICVPLIISAMQRLQPIPGILHATGVLTVAAGVLIYLVGTEQFNSLIDPYAVPALITTLIAIIAGVWNYVEYERSAGYRMAVQSLAKLREDQLAEMRERARALTEMTTVLAGTSDIKKILDAALDVGRFSLKKQNERRSPRLIGMALLVRSSDEALYMVNSRGIPYTDENRVIPGKDGIVGKALEDCVTVIGKDASKDIELKTIQAFFGIRSVLCIPLRAKYDNYGVLLFGSDRPNAFNEDHIDTLNVIGVQTAVALQNAYLYNTLLEEKERIIQLEEAGRKSLVRDLHDVPAQTIAAVKMRINIIQRLMDRNPAQVPTELKEVEDLAQRANEEIRHILSSLNPLALESQGLRAALDQFADRIRKQGQRIDMRVSQEAETYLDKTKQGAVYYLVEEAVGNAQKYAEAALIKVVVGRKGNVMYIQIEDNGKGFDPTIQKKDGREHFGMTNMRQRAETLEGALDLRSEPGKGTLIMVRFPIDTMSGSTEYIADTKLARKAMDTFEKMMSR